MAETLITIGMIGVIAALTLPTLMNSTNDKEIVARVKKVNATLNEAYGRAYAKYGPIDTWFQTSDSTNQKRSERIGKRMAEFLQVEKICGTAITGCFTSGYGKTLSNSNALSYSLDSYDEYYRILLSDGTSIAFSGFPATFGLTGNTYYTIYFDINGPKKGKFVAGEDLFTIYIAPHKNRVGIFLDECTNKTIDKCISGSAKNVCTAWVLNNDNADYLQDDTNGKCPNGTVLSDSNPTCNEKIK